MNLLRIIKKLGWLALLVSVAPTAWGFALLGPLTGAGSEPWQTPAIGYDQANTFFLGPIFPGGPIFLQDIGGPHNLGEGYRRNTPTLYYACDANFLGFFGLDGLQEIDKAFAIMNTAMTNNPTGMVNGVDGYSAGLTEFPLETVHVNPTAQALFLTDLKSTTLHALVEQMGLDQPERFTWTLAERTGLPGIACPLGEVYLVVQRNFDIINSPVNQVQYSPYVNGTLYSYFIEEACAGTPTAVTVPFPVDPFADTYTSVAADNFNGLNIGSFYSGLTRDDVAGIRYLLSANNLATENAAASSFLELTNLGQLQLLSSSNFTTLFIASQTNDPATLATLFPAVVVDTVNSSYGFTEVCTPNVISYLTNFNGEPFGSPAHFVVVTNGLNCDSQELFTNVFANVITNGNLTNSIVLAVPNVHLNYYTNTAARQVTQTLGTKNGQPFPAPIVTNTTTKIITITNQPSGEYLVLPPNQCGWKIVKILSTNTPFNGHPELATTNVIASATNANGFVDTQSIVTYFTNHTFEVQAISCSNVVDVPRLRPGIEKIQFIRADFDSLIGQFWQPVTNEYTMNVLTNGQLQTLRYQRIRTTPDFLLTAQNGPILLGGNDFDGTIARTISYDATTALTGLAGPGVINSLPAPLAPTTITYNKVGTAFQNGMLFENFFATNAFAFEFDQMPVLQWASFDASTNPPVIYPNGTSIQNLTNLIFTTISPTPPLLPAGFAHSPYSPVTLTLTGGAFTTPYAWTAAGLPAGMTLTSNSDSTATLSGTPTQSGTFDFTVTLTDVASRSVQWTYTITIIP